MADPPLAMPEHDRWHRWYTFAHVVLSQDSHDLCPNDKFKNQNVNERQKLAGIRQENSGGRKDLTCLA